MRGDGRVEFDVEESGGRHVSGRSDIRRRGPGICGPRAACSRGATCPTPAWARAFSGARRLMDEFRDRLLSGRAPACCCARRSPRSAAAPSPEKLARIAGAATASRRDDLLDELRHENQELLHAMEELRRRQEELNRLNTRAGGDQPRRGGALRRAGRTRRAAAARRPGEIALPFAT